MAITHGGYTFESVATYDTPEVESPELNDVTDQFFGVSGESEVTDSPHGRFVRIYCDFNGYDTALLLSQAMSRIEGKINQIADQTLSIDLAGSTDSYVHCTFKGVEYLGGKRQYVVPGSGIKWRQEGRLVFRQLKIT